MRTRATDDRGWSTSRRSPIGPKAVLFLLAVTFLGGLFTSVTPKTASADQLDDAYARQQQLQKQIKRQRASIETLAQGQALMTARIADTKDTLKDINANLVAGRAQIVSITVDIAKS